MPDGTDRGRGLVERGFAESEMMGGYCRTHELVPDMILTSPARRTRETVDSFCTGLGGAPAVREAEALYLGSPSELLGEIRALDAAGVDAQALLVVGHNPGLHALALGLAAPGAGPALKQLSEKFPTAALAAFEVGLESWRTLRPGAATLVRYVTPKSLR